MASKLPTKETINFDRGHVWEDFRQNWNRKILNRVNSPTFAKKARKISIALVVLEIEFLPKSNHASLPLLKS